ncbi:MAG: adenylate/guanylate cyclase domain-containing protein [Treponema sp.]|uniref:adenylate/guanylate cyclase domain-containing protein n=1 Tax=Treponema sp. TaxID=166 RepID=UPI0025E36B38|nr:adenylate/guanylate cyclase domain-containing protein [Treponema sp.]MBQ8679292.1 adenylate/guanylate cyclase domain-containing protein [Treponema sp.]
MKKSPFQKVGSTSIIPISLKILVIFVSLLLLSNFSTNFVNSHLSRRQIINLNNTIMINQLKDIYTAAGNQYQILTFTGKRDESVAAISNTAKRGFELPNSIAVAFDKSGKILFCASATPLPQEQKEKSEKDTPALNELSTEFSDSQALQLMNQHLEEGITDGSILFISDLGQYYGVYKYQDDWDCYFVRAELRSDTMRSNNTLFGIISLVIIFIVAGFLIAGIFMFKKILLNVHKITADLYEMQEKQKLSTIDLSDSPNDDVTYLAASFNSLSSTINNLLGIFQKFASKDVVAKAYKEHQIRLEGCQRNLVMLFSDIKSFTYRTETLGNDIIDLLNVHYDKVIKKVHDNSGVIGSIIGDAILAIYGTQTSKNKSLDALTAAWEITRVTAELRSKMVERRSQIEQGRALTEAEERIYQAVLIDIGVGIDGGNVFYGNIGSDEHMTNTVIGDNVNSASRLEGLTRIYKLPVIVSGYIKDEIEQAGITKYKFFEIDTVQVKGKTEGKKIYFPMDTERQSGEEKFEIYEKALQAYYKGDWDSARTEFKKCEIEAAQVFLERIGSGSAPKNWSGIWTMQTK